MIKESTSYNNKLLVLLLLKNHTPPTPLHCTWHSVSNGSSQHVIIVKKKQHFRLYLSWTKDLNHFSSTSYRTDHFCQLLAADYGWFDIFAAVDKPCKQFICSLIDVGLNSIFSHTATGFNSILHGYVMWYTLYTLCKSTCRYLCAFWLGMLNICWPKYIFLQLILHWFSQMNRIGCAFFTYLELDKYLHWESSLLFLIILCHMHVNLFKSCSNLLLKSDIWDLNLSVKQ